MLVNYYFALLLAKMSEYGPPLPLRQWPVWLVRSRKNRVWKWPWKIVQFVFKNGKKTERKHGQQDKLDLRLYRIIQSLWLWPIPHRMFEDTASRASYSSSSLDLVVACAMFYRGYAKRGKRQTWFESYTRVRTINQIAHRMVIANISSGDGLAKNVWPKMNSRMRGRLEAKQVGVDWTWTWMG